MSRLRRAEMGGRVYTYAGGDSDIDDGIPRVYVGSRTTFEDGAADVARAFSTVPSISFGDDYSLTPAAARELAQRLLVGAVQAEVECGCRHEFWQHYDGRSCDGRNERDELCQCATFTPAIALSTAGL